MDTLGIDDWVVPPASPFTSPEADAPRLSANADDHPLVHSSAVADRLERKGLPAQWPKALAFDDGPDDWITGPAQDPRAGNPAATAGRHLLGQLPPVNDGGADDWIVPAADAGPRLSASAGKPSISDRLRPTAEAALAGIKAGTGDLAQTVETLRGGRPQVETERSPGAADFDWSDFSAPLAQGLPKVAYRLGKSYPSLAGGIAGGTLGGGVGAATGPAAPVLAPAGALIGGTVGAAAMSAAQTLGPSFARHLQETPGDPEGAWNRAYRDAEISGVFGGAGWALFPVKFFQGPVKQLLFQAFGVQPGVSVAHQVTRNVVEGKPTLEGAGNAYVEGAVGTAVPLTGHRALSQLGRYGFGNAKMAAMSPDVPDTAARTPADLVAQVEAELRRDGTPPDRIDPASLVDAARWLRDLTRGPFEAAATDGAPEAAPAPIESGGAEPLVRRGELPMLEALRRGVIGNGLGNGHVTPAEMEQVYGKGRADELRSNATPRDGEAAPPQGVAPGRPGPDAPDSQQLRGPGEDGGAAREEPSARGEQQAPRTGNIEPPPAGTGEPVRPEQADSDHHAESRSGLDAADSVRPEEAVRVEPVEGGKRGAGDATDNAADTDPNHRPELPPIAVRLTGDELGQPRYEGHLRLLARQYAEENLLGRLVTNAQTGIQIGFNRSGLKKATSGKRGPDLLRLVPAIPDMLERGTYFRTGPDSRGRRTVKAVHHFASAVNLRGQRFDTILFVRETNDGRFFYDYGIMRGPGMPGLARP